MTTKKDTISGLIPPKVDLIFDGRGNPLCSRQAIINRISQQNSYLRNEVEKMRIDTKVIDQYDETNSRDDAVDKGKMLGHNQALSDILKMMSSKDE